MLHNGVPIYQIQVLFYGSFDGVQTAMQDFAAAFAKLLELGVPFLEDAPAAA